MARFKTPGEFGWEFTAERGKVIGPSQATSQAILGKLVLREEMKRTQETLEILENRIRRDASFQVP